MGIVLLARGKMSGVALLLVSLVGGLTTFLVGFYALFTIRPSEPMPYESRAESDSAAAHVSYSRAGSHLEFSAGRHNDPPEIASLEPTPLPSLGPVVIPEGRPEWVEAAPTEEEGTLFVSVNSGPYENGFESRRALDDKLLEVTESYIEDVLDKPQAAGHVDFSAREIREYWVAEEYSEVIEVSFGPMHQSHARLKFDDSFVAQLEERWQQAVVASRLAATTLFFVAATAILGAVYLFLRIDTATRGYYSGRLQLGAGVAILGIIVAGVLAARWIPWL